MAVPIIKWYVETAGQTSSLQGSPQNWVELSSAENESGSQIVFGSSVYSDTKVYPMDKEEGNTIAPEAMYIKYKPGTNSEKFIKINNWGKNAPHGLYNLCIKFTSPRDILGDYDPVSMLGYPRIEAYDSTSSLDRYLESTKELIVGTKTEPLPLLRAIDTTAEAIGLLPSSGWPPPSWWSQATYGADDGRIKALNATLSYLESSTVIVPEGGYTYLPNETTHYSGLSFSQVFYFSICPVIPSDSFRGIRGHDVVITCRAHFL